MKLASKIIIGILPLLITACNAPKTESLKGIAELTQPTPKEAESNIQKKDFYSLTEYEANPKSIGMGEHSFTFGDYILELKGGNILVYTLGVSGACG